MFRDQAEAVRIQAAEETLTRLTGDQARVSHPVKPLIDYIKAHLFDPDLQVGTMLRECGVHDHKVPALFTAELERTPWNYITECRLEIAARMLRRSGLRAWRIAASVGYSGPHAFSRAFKRWCGRSPQEYRQAPKIDLPAAAPAGEQLVRELGKALAGELDPGQAEVLVSRLRAIDSRLRAIYPHLRHSPPAVPGVDAELAETVMAAKRLWRRSSPDRGADPPASASSGAGLT